MGEETGVIKSGESNNVTCENRARNMAGDAYNITETGTIAPPPPTLVFSLSLSYGRSILYTRHDLYPNP